MAIATSQISIRQLFCGAAADPIGSCLAQGFCHCRQCRDAKISCSHHTAGK
ncbi:hypothetical protein [Rhizobium metallidurans]|uniref:Uncharacterized protein n=1 Tax=Rhizobium metallidurans TaxID=1265931 RepID=A0A7W6CM20_9HYPH|nr:hypothetical protein [Rhizobium metallidurans]MBB3962776.1 hypothetical protein [Rhizobium metallidurans]